MEKKKQFILIPRENLERMIRNYCIASYSVLMFAQLAELKKLEIHLSTDDVCEILDLTRIEIEQFRNKDRLKSFEIGGIRVYSAYDIARIAELKHRKTRSKLLDSVLSIDAEKLEKFLRET